MSVDEAREQKPAAQIAYLNVRMGGTNFGVIAASDHATMANQKTGVLERLERSIVQEGIARRVKDACSQDCMVVLNRRGKSARLRVFSFGRENCCHVPW